MTDRKGFWIGTILVIAAVYAFALVLALQGRLPAWGVRFAIVLFAAHALEIPVAFRKLRGKDPQPLRVVLATLLFGLAWWMPAQRGLFAVR